MSEKKESRSHENRLVGYVKPSQKIFVEAYSVYHNESVSNVIQHSISKLIESTPVEIKVQIMQRYKDRG